MYGYGGFELFLTSVRQGNCWHVVVIRPLLFALCSALYACLSVFASKHLPATMFWLRQSHGVGLRFGFAKAAIW